MAAKPDRPATNQVTHHDAVGVTLADRDLVDADGLGSGSACLGQLRRHVLLLKPLDRVPVELELLGDVLDRGTAAAPADIEGEALRVERIGAKEAELLPLHLAATATEDTPHLEFEKHPCVAAGQIAHAPAFAVVPARVFLAAGATDCFFTRRLRVMTRAFGSPKTPRTVGSGRKPGKAYDSDKRRLGLGVGMAKSCQNFASR